MTEEYAISNGRVFVKDEDEMFERDDVVCEEQLELENEIEILEGFLRTAKNDYNKVKNSKKPKHFWLKLLGLTSLFVGVDIAFAMMSSSSLLPTVNN